MQKPPPPPFRCPTGSWIVKIVLVGFCDGGDEPSSFDTTEVVSLMKRGQRCELKDHIKMALWISVFDTVSHPASMLACVLNRSVNLRRVI
jgi:hypothetical protein